MIFSRFIDGLISLLGGIYGTLLGLGVIKIQRDPENAAAYLKQYGIVLKILGPLVSLWGLYLVITSF
jgi:hypothetical protein